MSNVPQDVMENTHKPDLIEKLSGLAKSIEVCEGWRPTCIDEAIAQLRAQRQQGSEPVAWAVESIGNPDTNYGRVKSFETLAEAKQRAKELYDAGFEDIKVHELYTTPPQSNALVAAAYRQAADVLEERAKQWDAIEGHGASYAGELRHMQKRILEAIPADAEAALREVCMEVAESEPTCQTCNGNGVIGGMLAQGNGEHYYDSQDCPDCNVNSVLGEGKS
jgi:hypothetical protein